MVAGKMFQANVKRIHFLSAVSSRADFITHSIIQNIVGRYNLYRKIVRLFFFEFLPSYMYELLVRMKDYIARKYYVMGDQFRGRRILRNSGSVSFFLERLAEEKPQTENQTN